MLGRWFVLFLLVLVALGCEVERTESSTVIRAYPSIAGRQQDADRLVHDEAEFRRILWQAVDPSHEGPRPSTIRLGANIFLSSPVALGSHAYHLTIEGGGRYGFLVRSGHHFFDVGNETVTDLLFRGVSFTNASGSSDVRIIRAASDAAILARVSFEGVTTVDVTSFYRADSGSPTWRDSTVADCLSIVSPSPIEIADAVLLAMRFDGNFSRSSLISPWYLASQVRNAPDSQRNTYFGTQPVNDVTVNSEVSHVLGLVTDSTIRSRLVVSPVSSASPTNPFIVFGESWGAVPTNTGIYGTMASVNVTAEGRETWRMTSWDARAMMALSLEPAERYLVDHDPEIDPTRRSYFRVTVEKGATGSISLLPGQDGQLLTLAFASVDPVATAMFVEGSGRFTSATGDYTPVTDGSLTLIFDGVSNVWRELARTPNASGGGGGGDCCDPVVSEVIVEGKEPTLDVGESTFVRVQIGEATGPITILPGVDGQRVTLVFTAVAGDAYFDDGFGRFQGAADFIPTVRDTLDLVFNAASDEWIEVSRSAN